MDGWVGGWMEGNVSPAASKETLSSSFCGLICLSQMISLITQNRQFQDTRYAVHYRSVGCAVWARPRGRSAEAQPINAHILEIYAVLAQD